MSGIRRVVLLSSLLAACARPTGEQDQEAASTSFAPGSEGSSGDATSTSTVIQSSDGGETTSVSDATEVGSLAVSSGSSGDGSAGADDSGTGEPGPPSDCCTIAPAPGCADLDTQACVCAQDPYCCDKAWDEACVNAAKYGTCGTVCAQPVELGPCCTGGDTPGCEDDAIATCVCAVDPYCCTTQWDDVCVGYVAQYACGSCD